MARGEVLGNQGAERMADDMGAADAEMRRGVLDRIDQEFDGDFCEGDGDRPAPGKSGRTMRKPASCGTIA